MHSPLVITFVAVAAHLVGASSQGSSHVITNQTDDATKTWKSNEEERVAKEVEVIAENIISVGSKGVTKSSNHVKNPASKEMMIDQMQKVQNAEHLFLPSNSPTEVKLLIASSYYEIDVVVKMAFAKLGTAEDTRAKEVLQALITYWHEQGVPPADVSNLLKVQIDKDVFGNPRYAEFEEYVRLFNVGKPKEQQVSALSFFVPNFTAAEMRTILRKTETPEDKKKLAAAFYTFLQTKGSDGHDGLAYLDHFIFI